MSKELPLRKIIFNRHAKDGFGMYAVSEVLDPAIKANFVLLNAEYKAELAVQSKEKRTVFGPILIPGMKIYRNQAGEEYNLTMDAETIEQIVIDFFANDRANNVVQNHINEITPGFTFYQSVITNDLIPTVKNYEQYPIGTAFFGAYVDDDDRLKEIEEGKFKGWSIHGAFDRVPVEMRNQHDDKLLEEILRGIFDAK